MHPSIIFIFLKILDSKQETINAVLDTSIRKGINGANVAKFNLIPDTGLRLPLILESESDSRYLVPRSIKYKSALEEDQVKVVGKLPQY
jgi:hypothetical protein